MKNGASNSGKVKKRKTEAKVKVTPSSGNVFAGLGIPNAAQYLAKAELARRICAIIAERKLTQTKAATLLGIDQTKMAALRRGLFDGFSSDRLFRILNQLGQDVEIAIKPHRLAESQGQTRVLAS